MDDAARDLKRRAFLKNAGSAASLFAVSRLPGFDLAAEAAEVPVRREPGFVPLFDGVSLKGWTRQIREPLRPGLGIWTVQNGMIVGGQDVPTIGSYLVTDETFSDFELTLEARPDWRADTGVLVRTNAQGNVGSKIVLTTVRMVRWLDTTGTIWVDFTPATIASREN